MRKVMLLLALLFALSSAAPPPLESALEPSLKELRRKDSGKDNLKLMTHEDYPKRTHDERMLSMAYTLKNHFAHKPLTLKVAQDAIDAHVANGRMPGEHKLLLVTEVGTLLGPAAAAAAGLEVTSEDIDEAVGEGGSTGKHLEEGGAEGMDGEEEEKSNQGDEELGSGDDEVRMHDMKFPGATSLYTAGPGKPWTDNTVNYCFEPAAKTAVRQVIARSVEVLKRVMPCIVWKGMHTHSLAHSRVAPCPCCPCALSRRMASHHLPWTQSEHKLLPHGMLIDVGYKSAGECNANPAVYITSLNSGCWAYVGEVTHWKSQGLNLQSPGCDSLGTSIHELLHALGQKHEQSRPDRDTYVTVDFAKIEAGKQNNFEVDALEDVGRPYDMLSLMHYDAKAFSTNGMNTITPKPAAYGLYTNNSAEYHKYSLGNRVGMTQTDADQLAAQARAQSPDERACAHASLCSRAQASCFPLCTLSTLALQAFLGGSGNASTRPKMTAPSGPTVMVMIATSTARMGPLM